MAALNFPDPNVTTSYTNPDTGITYEWSNGIWKAVRTAQTAPELFVDADGDNLTGNLTLGTDKIVLNATTGAATFAGDVSTGRIYNSNIQVTSTVDNTYQYRAVFNDDCNFTVTNRAAYFGGTQAFSGAGANAQINSDGSAMFGTTSSGASGAGGMEFTTTNGQLDIINTNSGSFITGYNRNSTSQVFNIGADGSATFAGEIVSLSSNSTGNVTVGDLNYSGFDYKWAHISQNGSTVLSAIKPDGSAEFAGNVVSGSADPASSPGVILEADKGQLSANRGNFYTGFDGYFQVGYNSTNTPVYTIASDGSATFADNVSVDKYLTVTNSTLSSDARVQIQGDQDVAISVYPTTAGARTIELKHDGSATFGNTNFGTNGNVGAKIDGPAGEILLQRNTNTDALFRGYSATGSQNVLINADGSTTFAGNNRTSGTSFISKTTAGYRHNLIDGGYYINNDANNVSTVALNADGSANFASNVGIGTTSTKSMLTVNGNIVGLNAGTHSWQHYQQASANYTATSIDSEISGPAGSLVFKTGTNWTHSNAIEQVRIDPEGRMLVGTDSSVGSALLQIQGDSNNSIAGASFYLRRGEPASSISNGELISYIGFSDNAGGTFGVIRCDADSAAGPGNYPGRISFHTTANGASSPTERMRISSGGVVSLVQNQARFALSTQTGLLVPLTIQNSGNNTSATLVQFTGWNGSVIGSITGFVNQTTYATSSDYRLKENVVDLTNATDRLKQLRPKRFNFIENPDLTLDGFLAHEAQQVVSNAVTGEHDEIDQDGDPVYQGMDHSKLVPLLTAALQEALAEIESLKARVATLEP